MSKSFGKRTKLPGALAKVYNNPLYDAGKPQRNLHRDEASNLVPLNAVGFTPSRRQTQDVEHYYYWEWYKD